MEGYPRQRDKFQDFCNTTLDVATGDCTARLRDKDRKSDFRVIAFSRDGSMLASGHSDSMIQVWDVLTHVRKLIIGPLNDVPFSIKPKTSRPSHFLSLAFSPDGRTLAIGQNYSISLWSLETNQLLSSVQISAAFALGYSDRGELLGAGTGRGDVKLVDIASGRLKVITLDAHMRMITSVEFQDVRRIISASPDHRVVVSDIFSGQPPKTLHDDGSGGDDRIFSAALIPCRNVFVTASGDAVLRFWDIEKGLLIKKLSLDLVGHEIADRMMAFSPGGRTLAVASPDGYVMVYDLRKAIEPDRSAECKNEIPIDP